MQIKKLGEKQGVKTKKGDPEPWAQPPPPGLPRLGKSCPIPLFPTLCNPSTLRMRAS